MYWLKEPGGLRMLELAGHGGNCPVLQERQAGSCNKEARAQEML